MEGFFRRGYRTLAVVTAFITLGLWAYWGWQTALACLAGMLIGALTLGGTILAVEGLVRPPGPDPRPRWPYLAVHLGKFIPAAGLAWAVFRWLPAQFPLVVVGYTVSMLVILLRLAGRSLNRKLGVGPRNP